MGCLLGTGPLFLFDTKHLNVISRTLLSKDNRQINSSQEL